MREILFKAKRIDNGEWVEGQYCYIRNPKSENGEPKKHFICNGTNVFNTEIDPETLCQYTGLTDKNGKSIFENDIIRFAEWSKGEMCWEGQVKYENCLFVVSGGPNKECETEFYLQLSRIPSERIEVIGNIHDKEN